jgi:hypothetical protein
MRRIYKKNGTEHQIREKILPFEGGSAEVWMGCSDPGFVDACSIRSPTVVTPVGKDVETTEVPNIGLTNPTEPTGYDWKEAC